jgi:hypothetical protein
MAPVCSGAGSRWGAIALGALVSFVAPASAVAAEEATGLAFVAAGDEPVPVPMAKSYRGEFSGRLNITVKNNSDVPGRLRLLFIPANSGRAFDLGRDRDELVRRVRPAAERMRIAAHDLKYVRLALHVPSRASLSSVDGLVVAKLRPSPAAKTDVPAAELRIVGKPKQARDVSFEPAEVTMGPVRYCAFLTFRTCYTSAEVTLRGDGARRLMEDGREPEATGILHTGSGATITARLEGLTADANGVVTGTVNLTEIDDSGEYKGVLAVAPGGEGAAQIPLTVNVRNSFLFAFIAVLLGAALAYVMRWREQIGLRRRRLRGRLDVAIRRYEKLRDEHKGEAPASFDLATLLGDPPWDTPIPDAEGIGALRYDIDQAEQDADWGQLARRVDHYVSTISRWLEVERAVQHAGELAETEVPDLDGHRIKPTQCWTQLDALITEADSKDVLRICRNYLMRLEGQVKLYREFSALWNRKSGLQRRRDVDLEKLEAIDVWGVLDGVPGPDSRTAKDLADARSELRRLDLELDELTPETEPPRPAPAAYGATKTGRVAKRARRRAQTWDSSLTAELVEERNMRAKQHRHRRLWAPFNRHDVLWTFVAIAVASVGYALTLYDDTWGSVVDFLTAFAAGFGVKFGADAAQTIDWGSVPVVGPLLGGLTGTSGRESPAPASGTDDDAEDAVEDEPEGRPETDPSGNGVQKGERVGGRTG